MSFTDQMASLRTSLNDTKKRTIQAVREVKKDTREMVAGFAQTQKVNARQLRQDLEKATQNLVRVVKEMRQDNISSQQTLRGDFISASRVFRGKQKAKEEKKEKEE